MTNGLSDLMRLHPASRFGRAQRRSDLEACEAPGGQDPRTRHRHGAGRYRPDRTIGPVVAAVAMLAFARVLTLIAGLA